MPLYLLKKLQSLDCKTFKLVLGVLRSSAVPNPNEAETAIKSDIDFPRRAKSISSQMSVATDTVDLFHASRVSSHEAAPRLPVSECQ